MCVFFFFFCVCACDSASANASQPVTLLMNLIRKRVKSQNTSKHQSFVFNREIVQRWQYVALSCVITKIEIKLYTMARDWDKSHICQLLCADITVHALLKNQSQSGRRSVFITMSQLDNCKPKAVNFPSERQRSHLSAIKGN